PISQVLNIYTRDFQLELGDQFLFPQFFIRVEQQFRLAVLRVDGGYRSLLRHRVAFELHFQVLFISLCGFNLKVGVDGLLLHLRVRQFDNHRRWVDLYAHAGLKKNLFYAALSRRRYPASYLGHEGSVATYVAYHLTAFDGLDYRGRAVERGRSGL